MSVWLIVLILMFGEHASATQVPKNLVRGLLHRETGQLASRDFGNEVVRRKLAELLGPDQDWVEVEAGAFFKPADLDDLDYEDALHSTYDVGRVDHRFRAAVYGVTQKQVRLWMGEDWWTAFLNGPPGQWNMDFGLLPHLDAMRRIAYPTDEGVVGYRDEDFIGDDKPFIFTTETQRDAVMQTLNMRLADLGKHAWPPRNIRVRLPTESEYAKMLTVPLDAPLPCNDVWITSLPDEPACAAGAPLEASRSHSGGPLNIHDPRHVKNARGLVGLTGTVWWFVSPDSGERLEGSACGVCGSDWETDPGPYLVRATCSPLCGQSNMGVRWVMDLD